MDPEKDVIILVADTNMEKTVSAILTRQESLKIHEIKFDVFVHPEHDAGVFNNAHEYLRYCQSQSQSQYKYAMVLFDKKDCGFKGNREDIEKKVEDNLIKSGWGDRCSVIAIDPELEIWVWSESPHVATALGWKMGKLNSWLKKNNFILSNETKPRDPKEAMESALAKKRIPRSSSIYAEIAQNVSLKFCTDSSFLKFKKTLQQWFSNQSE